MILIRGTTPTFVVTFDTVTVSDITAAYLVFKDKNKIVLEKDLSAATVKEKALEWNLTQEDSFLVGKSNRKSVNVSCDWKLADGTRGRSKIVTCVIEAPAKEEVI